MPLLTVRREVLIKWDGHISLWKKKWYDYVWEQVGEGHNLLTNAGSQYLLDLAFGNETTYYDYIALGDSATVPAVTDTTLTSELTSGRVQATNTTATNKTIVVTAYFSPSEAVGNVREWGILNAASAGTLLCHGLVEPVVAKTADDELLAEITITLS